MTDAELAAAVRAAAEALNGAVDDATLSGLSVLFDADPSIFRDIRWTYVSRPVINRQGVVL